MMTGTRGTFVISWSQTELDGERGAPLAELRVGAQWRWWGEAVAIGGNGPGGALILPEAEGAADLRRRAARAVRRLVAAACDRAEGFAPQRYIARGADRAEPAEDGPDHGFTATDGRRIWAVTVVDMPARGARLLMFTGDVPPAETDLWIVSRTMDEPQHTGPAGIEGAGVICFTRGTRIATPFGPVAVEDLRPGDRISTLDDGPQEVLWSGHRRMTGARLYAMPHLRPIRIRAGAMGEDRPDADLIVSPEHRMLVRGAAAMNLFNTPEVLVAAGDLIDGQMVHVDQSLKEVTYHHLLLDRHQVVWANGIETESFHPAHAALDMIAADQRAALASVLPGVAGDPHRYGAFARRNLDASEAAILRHDAA